MTAVTATSTGRPGQPAQALASTAVITGGRPSKPESGNGLVLRVTHHKYAAPLIVSTAGTVNLWLAATAS